MFARNFAHELSHDIFSQLYEIYKNVTLSHDKGGLGENLVGPKKGSRSCVWLAQVCEKGACRVTNLEKLS